MKKTIAAIAALMLTAVATYGQGLGTVLFSTKVGADPNIKFQNGDGTILGPGFTVQLVLVNGTSTTPLTPTTTFRTDVAAAGYYVNAIEVAVPGTAPSQNVTMKIQAFNGATYATSSRKNETATFTVALGGDNLPPGNLSSVQTITVPPAVPEPSTIALGLLGLGSLLVVRRRK